MVTVIGRDPNFQANCTNCGSELAYERKEILAGDRIDHDDYQGYIICPTCSQPVRVRQTVSAEEAARQRRENDIY